MAGSTRAILFARSTRLSMRSIWPSSASMELAGSNGPTLIPPRTCILFGARVALAAST